MMRFFSNEGIGEVKGLFSTDHLIYVILSILLLITLLVLTRKMTKEKTTLMIRIIAIVITILEIIKIVWNLTARADARVEDYMPLYFCSLFIYALLGFSFVNGTSKFSMIIHKASTIFLFYGGIVGGTVFMLFPTTALSIRPLLHFLSFHSLIFHTLMVFVAVKMVKYYYEPNIKDFWLYFISLFIIEVPLVVINSIYDTNFMMLHKPFDIEFLEWIGKISGWFYPGVIIIGQNVGSFMIPYGCHKLSKRIKK